MYYLFLVGSTTTDSQISISSVLTSGDMIFFTIGFMVSVILVVLSIILIALAAPSVVFENEEFKLIQEIKNLKWEILILVMSGALFTLFLIIFLHIYNNLEKYYYPILEQNLRNEINSIYSKILVEIAKKNTNPQDAASIQTRIDNFQQQLNQKLIYYMKIIFQDKS